ncbi:MAG: hypothetical protein MUQ56_00975, partial [Thermoleophilia bacterium]|nr:hypothetical protein [Thermoleophilia bacterium]
MAGATGAATSASPTAALVSGAAVVSGAAAGTFAARAARLGASPFAAFPAAGEGPVFPLLGWSTRSTSVS